MSEQQKNLIERAKAKYGQIYPCGGKADYRDCFSEYSDQVFFWFNTLDNSTHIEQEIKG
jgi:hypothetical protein